MFFFQAAFAGLQEFYPDDCLFQRSAILMEFLRVPQALGNSANKLNLSDMNELIHKKSHQGETPAEL